MLNGSPRIASTTSKLLLPLVALLAVASAAGAATPTNLVIRATVKSFRSGTIGTYNVTVSNVGAAATDADIHVTDVLPEGLTLLSNTGADWTCSAAGQAVDCVMTAPLPIGRSTTFRINVDVCTAPGVRSIRNSLFLFYPADTKLTNNTVTRSSIVKPGRCTPRPTPTSPKITGTPAPARTATATASPLPTATPVPAGTDLSLSKAVGSTFTVGSTGAYLLTVTNVGTSATNAAITVTDVLPASLGFVSATGAEWTCSANGQVLTCTSVAPLAPGAATRITLVVRVGSTAYPSVTNTATLSYAGDTNPANNRANRPTTVRQ